MSQFTWVPGDNQLVEHIIGELKSKGIFDQFRKECIADVDTKPAYQNLRLRVENSVSTFLSHQKWKPDLNKNQLREKLRRHINEANYLEQGVERIVDQVVNPKVASVFIPQVEDLVYSYLGIQKPKSEDSNGTKNYTIDDSIPLPNEAKITSHESCKNEVTMTVDEVKSEDVNMDVDEVAKPDKEEQFEQVTKNETINVTLADIISQDSNESTKKEEYREELIVTTELSNLSIDIPLPEGPQKTEMQEESTDFKQSDTETSFDSTIVRNISPLTPIRSFNNENSCDAQPSFDERKNEVESVEKEKNTESSLPISTFRFTIEKDCDESDSKPNKTVNIERSVSYQYEQNNTNNCTAPNYDDSSSSNNLQIDYQSDKDSKQDHDAKMETLVFHDESKSKEASNDDKKKSHKSSHSSKDSHRYSSSKHKDRKYDSKHHSSDKRDSSRTDKKSSKDESSHKSRHSSHSEKSKDRNDRDKKENTEKNETAKKDSSEKRDKDRSDSSKDRHASHKSSSTSKDSKSKHHSSSSSRHHSSSYSKDEKKSSSSRNDDKKDDRDHHKSSSKTSRDSSKHSSHHRSDKDKYKSSSSKDKENRDKDTKKGDNKDKKVVDDHYSASGRSNRTRRSTDRDSNDGNSSSSKGSTLMSATKTASSTNDHKSSSSKSDNHANGGDSTSPSDVVDKVSEETENVIAENDNIDSNKSTKPVLKLESQLKTPVAESKPMSIDKVLLKKPMIADNINDVRLTKIRQQMAAEEEKKREEAALLIEFQEKIHSSISHSYSEISGPELEFACVQKEMHDAQNKQSKIQGNDGSGASKSDDINDKYFNFVYGDPNKDIELQYFSQREIYNTVMEKENLKTAFNSLEIINFTKTAFLINCDVHHENLIQECYKEIGLKYKTVNINQTKNSVIPKKLSNQDLNKKELILPVSATTATQLVETDDSNSFNPNISTDSLDSNSDYERKIDEMIQSKSRQEVMEIILGGMATEFVCEPNPNIMNKEAVTVPVKKRKLNGLTQDDQNNQNMLIPHKIPKICLSEEISSTTQDEDNTNTPTNNIKSKYIGKARRVGLPKPKNSQKVTMSPSSDQSVENYDQNVKTSPKLNGVAGTRKSKLGQRYDTSDLYKPKLHFLSKRQSHVT